MARKYEVTAVTGKYTDNSGKEKSRYLNIGSVIETKNGLMLKLEAVPVGWDGWAYLNDPKPREESQRQAAAPAPQQSSSGFADMDDSSIPF
jgi:hypothetical protein